MRIVRVAGVVCGMVIGGATSASSEAGSWTGGGPFGGPVLRVLTLPSSPSHLLVWTPTGLEKSTDEGRSWVNLLFPSDAAAFSFTDVRVGTAGGTIYVLTDGPSQPMLLVSADEGLTWTSAQSIPPNGPVGVDPSSDRVLYAGDYNIIRKSTDGGDSWAEVFAGDPYFDVTAIAIDPLHPGTVFSAGAEGIVRSTDSGATWLQVDHETNTWIAQILVLPETAIAASPTGLLRSTDGGTSWTTVSLSGGVTALAADPGNVDHVFVGTATNGVFASTDGGSTWTAGGNTSGVSMRAISGLVITDSGQMIAATKGGGVAISTDDGSTWAPANVGLPPVVVDQVVVDSTVSAIAYALTSSAGVYKTTDAGQTWVAISSGLAHEGVTALAIDPHAHDHLYASSKTDNEPASLDQSTDGGQTWTEISTAPQLFLVAEILFDPETPGTVLLASDAGPVRSTDGGETWVVLASGLPAGYAGVASIAQIGSGFRDLYAQSMYACMISDSCAGMFGLFHSSDGGSSWSLVDPDDNLWQLTSDPTGSGILYALGASLLERCTDCGVTWTAALPVEPGASAYALIPGRPPRGWLADSVVGVADHSGSNREGWTLINDGLPDLSVTSLAVDSAGTRLYSTLATGGVFERDLVPRAAPTPDPVASQQTIAISSGRP